jgi:hypothetical protein
VVAWKNAHKHTREHTQMETGKKMDRHTHGTDGTWTLFLSFFRLISCELMSVAKCCGLFGQFGGMWMCGLPVIELEENYDGCNFGV